MRTALKMILAVAFFVMSLAYLEWLQGVASQMHFIRFLCGVIFAAYMMAASIMYAKDV